MPEIRKDPITGHCIIVAAARQKRPNDFDKQKTTAGQKCPFCAGNEHLTPPEIYSLPNKQYGNSAGKWQLRAVPNKFPAVDGDDPIITLADGLYSKCSAPGRHEVIIETPNHSGRIENMAVPHLSSLIKTCAMRATEMLKLPFIKYAMIFKNHGRAAGASLEHPHTQIAGIPLPPKRIEEEIKSCIAYMEKTGNCPFCDIIRQEECCGKRIIAKNALFTAFSPFASRTPFEINIFPKKHLSFFEEITADEADGLAEILKICIGKLACSIPELAYNIMFLSSPKEENTSQGKNIYHWHIEILPKLTQAAGFEWGTGFYINTVPPERAAEILNSGEIIS